MMVQAMQIDALKSIILEQHETLHIKQSSITRHLLRDLEALEHLKEHAIIVSGIRRCGKSTLLKQIYHQYHLNNAFFLSFEDERLVGLDATMLNQLHQTLIELFGDQKTFFFDEIQVIPGWEIFVRRMQDLGYKFYLSGSNASLLKGHASHKLTGRHITLRLFPYSFQEYLAYCHPQLDTSDRGLHHTKTRAQLQSAFTQTMRYGGMPGYWKYRSTEIVTQIYQDILFRDIIGQHQIREQRALRELGLYFLSNIGSQLSLTSLQKTLNLGSINTIKSFMSYFEDAYLFSFLPRYDYALKTRILTGKKVYCQDTGFITHLAFQFSENFGKILENMVYIELLRRKKELYSYQTRNRLEVDFAIQEGTKITELIQVAYNLNQEKTRKREIAALEKAMQETQLNTGTILTFSEHADIKTDWGGSIAIRAIVPWLLSNEST